MEFHHCNQTDFGQFNFNQNQIKILENGLCLDEPFDLETNNIFTIQKCEGAGCEDTSLLSDFNLGVYMVTEHLFFDDQNGAHLGSKINNAAKFALGSNMTYKSAFSVNLNKFITNVNRYSFIN